MTMIFDSDTDNYFPILRPYNDKLFSNVLSKNMEGQFNNCTATAMNKKNSIQSRQKCVTKTIGLKEAAFYQVVILFCQYCILNALEIHLHFRP